MIFGSVYIGVLWHQVKNYYNFQYGITTGYIELITEHMLDYSKIMLQVHSSELKKSVYSSIVLEYRLSQAEVAHICVFCPPQVVVPCVCKQLQQLGRTYIFCMNA